MSPYGESKTTIERILSNWTRHRGLRSIALRYFNACGGEPEHNLGEQHDPETHLIPLLLRAISTGEPIQIFGDDYPTPDGTCIRDYIHVSDLAEAHLAALDHLLSGGASDAFNVGTGSGLTVMEVLREVEHVTGEKVPYRLAPRREGDAASLVADSTKLRKSLGMATTPQQPAADHQGLLGFSSADSTRRALRVAIARCALFIEELNWIRHVEGFGHSHCADSCHRRLRLGCSSEICDLPADSAGELPSAFPGVLRITAHECFHKAATPEQASNPAPVLDASFIDAGSGHPVPRPDFR